MPHEELEKALAAALSQTLGSGVQVSDLRRLPGGASRETWAFEAQVADAQPATGTARALVLRRDPVGAPSAGLILEAELLAAADKAGVPVPRLVTSGPAGGPLQSAYVVVEHVGGETIPRKILRRVADEGNGEALAAQCGRILAALHGIEPASVPGLPGGDPLEQLRGILDHLGEPHPALEVGLRQLASTRPPKSAEVVVHGDFRNGNLIVGEEGIQAVLDWELAHRGDPLEDLGWLCARAWRFGAPLPVGGFGTLDSLLEAYEAASGTKVDRAILRWWEALASLRWGVICMVQAHTHLSGAARSVELATIGRRTAEAEWDLLTLLQRDEEGAPATAATATAGVTAATAAAGVAEPDASAPEIPHDRPTAPELLDAVEGFLRDEVMTATEGRVAFHVRVAANALAIVARQLRLGPAQAAVHRERLAAFGAESDGQLAVAIRTGELDERLAELRLTLRDAVADKLAVANPGYCG